MARLDNFGGQGKVVLNDFNNAEVKFVRPAEIGDELWLEWVTESLQNGSVSISHDGCSALMAMEIPWQFSGSIIPHVLGYHVPNAQTKKLERKLPVSHPWFPFLFARAISNYRGMQFDGRVNEFGTGARLTSQWKSVLFDIEFELPPYQNVLSDDDVTSELQRFTSWRSNSKHEFLQLEGGSLKFAEGPPKVAGAGTPKEFPVLKPGWALTISWFKVPVAYVFDACMFPVQWDKCIGRVNSIAFPSIQLNTGWPSETLLLDSIVVPDEPRPMPLVTDQAGRPVMVMPRVDFNFTAFNPTMAVGIGAVHKGHNASIWRGDLGWYSVTVSGVGGAEKAPFDRADMNLLFQHHAA